MIPTLLLALCLAAPSGAAPSEPEKSPTPPIEDERLLEMPSVPNDGAHCKEWRSASRRSFAMNGKVKDPYRKLLTGSHSCTAHICGNEKSVPGTKDPKGQNCECTEWKVSAQVSCSRKDEAGACVEWMGECKKTEGSLSCPAATQSCVAIHCHPAEKKG